MNNLLFSEWQNILAARPDLSTLSLAVKQGFADLYARRHGQFDAWLAVAESLDLALDWQIQLDTASVSAQAAEISVALQQQIEQAAVALMPWRKGPFQLGDLFLDCEWRSDMKYQRLLAANLDVSGKNVLDVGTGNGYFLYRLLGSGARLALGLDPSWHYFAQFLFLQRFFQQTAAAFLPLTLNEAPLTGFDVCLCMGVLYHRRDPLAFIAQLRDTLKSGGQLVLETLVVEGNSQTVYLPKARYAGMHNVWFLPSTAALCAWLERLGFAIEHCGAALATTALEQRRTPFMQSHSLSEFLQEAAAQGSQEPPPQRAIIIASKA